MRPALLGLTACAAGISMTPPAMGDHARFCNACTAQTTSLLRLDERSASWGEPGQGSGRELYTPHQYTTTRPAPIPLSGSFGERMISEVVVKIEEGIAKKTPLGIGFLEMSKRGKVGYAVEQREI